MTDKSSKTKGLFWLLAAILLGAVFALRLSFFVQAIPWRWEEKFSSYLPFTSSKACVSDRATQDLLDRLTRRLYPLTADDKAISLHIEVADNPVLNAYAGLGGNIVINKGLLEEARSAEEVAGVLAHEIEHVKQRHILENVLVRMLTVQSLQVIFTSAPSSNMRWLSSFLNLRFTREQESEADQGGLQRLQDAHIDNKGFKDFFKRMENDTSLQSFLSDHPDNLERYARADTFKNIDSQPLMTQEEWEQLKQYCH